PRDEGAAMDPDDGRAPRFDAPAGREIDVQPFVFRAAIADVALLADAEGDVACERGRGLRGAIAEGEARQQRRGPGRQSESGIADEGKAEAEQQNPFGASSHDAKLGRPAVPGNRVGFRAAGPWDGLLYNR